MSQFTTQQQIDCIAREIKMREFVFPTRIANKKMSQQKADHELACMNSILATLIGLQAVGHSPTAAEPALTADFRVGAATFKKGVSLSTAQRCVDRWINNYLLKSMTYFSTDGCAKHHGQSWTTFLGTTLMPTKECPLCKEETVAKSVQEFPA